MSVRETIRGSLRGAGVTGRLLDEVEWAVMAGLALVADEWNGASSTFYYQNRHAGPIDYAHGVEAGWDHAADLLRDKQVNPPVLGWPS